jgi:hypothetical protein
MVYWKYREVLRRSSHVPNPSNDATVFWSLALFLSPLMIWLIVVTEHPHDMAIAVWLVPICPIL